MGVAVIDARTQAKQRVKARAATDAVATGAGSSFGVDRSASCDDPATTAAQIERDEILASDERTLAQIQFDLFADMLLTSAIGADPTRDDDGPGTLGAIRATVQVVIPASTLLGHNEDPADLVGRSPIDADTARRLADATAAARKPWIRVITDPVTGTVLHTDARLASPSQRQFLKARDRRCRWPGCALPAIKCEIDHTIDHQLGGPTHVCNLACFCQRHHSMKQFTPWKVKQLGGGVLEFTSPLGHTYIDEPPAATVHFVPDTGSGAGADAGAHTGADADDPPPF
jgi:hypothetical protein